MLRFFVRFLLFVIAVGIIALAAGPLLVDPTPAVGETSAKSLARPESRFVDIPFPGTDGIGLHYLEQVGPIRPAQEQAVHEQVGQHDSAKEQATSKRGTPTFVLLHGFTFNAFTWNELLGFFGERGGAIAYDQIPYGLSAKPIADDWDGPNPYTREAAVEQLLAVMDAFGMDQAVLVGNSAGGALALETALAAPRRVAGLILIDPWVYIRRPTLPLVIAGLPQTERLSLFLARYLGERQPLLERSYADPGRITAERRALTGLHAGVAHWDLAWGELLHRSLTSVVAVSERLDEIEQPALVISGREDALVPVGDAERLAAALPGAGPPVVLPDCGHVPQEECPAQVADAIAGWLSSAPLAVTDRDGA